MMQQAGPSLAWVVKLVVVLVIVGAVLGVSLSHTDFFNFNTSAADMRAKDQITATQAQRDAMDQKVYEAQKQSELTTIEINTRAQQQAAALQSVKKVIDQQVYGVQQMVQVMRQVADAKQYEAQQLAQVEVQSKQQEAQVRTWEAAQEQNRAQEQARTEQEMALQRTLTLVAIGAGVVIVVALAASMIVFALLGGGRLKVARVHAAQIAAQTSSVAAVTSAAGQKEQLKAVWHTVSDLSRKQARLERELDGMRQTATGKTSAVQVHRIYSDLPLAK